MAAPAKRRNVEEEDDEDPSLDEDSENEDEGDGEEDEVDDAIGTEIPVNFDAQTPTDTDFHGIKRLLQQLFLKANVNLSALTDLILAQNFVGSVLKQTEEEEEEEDADEEMDTDSAMDVFGITTVINVSNRLSDGTTTPSEGDKAVKQMVDLLLEKCKKSAGHAQTKSFKDTLYNKDKYTGWLLNERFVNIPPQISLPLYDSLRDEMHEACAKGKSFAFENFLLVSKAFKVKSCKKEKEENLLFANGEEELFYEESSFSFSFSVADQQANADLITDDTGDDDDDDNEEKTYEPWRVVMILPAAKMEVVAKKMTDILGASIEGKVTSLR